MPGKTTLAACVIAALTISALIAQNPLNPSRQPAANAKSEPLPPVMHFCAQHCATFTLENGRYVRSAGGANNGSFTVMTIERFTRESVIIHRTDTGNFPGTALYTGQMSDDGGSISGNGWKITWGPALDSIPGSDEERARMAQKSAVKALPPPNPGSPPMHIPSKISQCEAGQCGVWEFNGQTGTAKWPSGASATLIVERFGFDGVTIRRDDYAGSTPGFSAVYTGKVFGDQIKGEVEWSWPGRWPAPKHGTWAATIAEPIGYTLLDPSLPCSQSYSVSAAEAVERASQAMDTKNADAGVCWLRIASNRGDPAANGLLAAVLYKGVGVPVNLAEAAALAQKAAAGSNYVGERCLWLMYQNGDVLPKDAAKAAYWLAKAEQDKLVATQADRKAEEEFRRQQQEARTIQNQQAQVQAASQRQVSPLALLFGLFLSSGDGAGSGSGDIAQRISSLERQLDSARDKCNEQINRTRGRESSYCDSRDHLQNLIAEAHGELMTEIQELIEAHNQLAADCGNGNKEACDKQQKVDARIASDRQFQFNSIFQ